MSSYATEIETAVRKISKKPHDKYTLQETATKQEATIIALAHDPFFRGATVIRQANKTLEEARADNYSHVMSEGWKRVNAGMVSEVASGMLEGIHDEKDLKRHFKEFEQGIPLAKRKEYEAALQRVSRKLYGK